MASPRLACDFQPSVCENVSIICQASSVCQGNHPSFRFETREPRGVLAMFAYEGVRAMFLGLKFYFKAIFLGLNFANMNFPFLGGRNFQQLPFSLDSIM